MERVSREIWAKRVERWKDSGLTAKEFAAETGINARTLTYWKWRLGKEAQQPDAPRPSRPKRDKRPKRPSLGPTFVEWSPPPGTVLSTALEVMVRSGAVVRVPVGFDAGTLRRVVTVLEART